MKTNIIATLAALAVMATAAIAGKPEKMTCEDTPRLSIISRSDSYVRYGWAVKVRNTKGDPSGKVFLKIRFLDKKGVMIEDVRHPLPPMKGWETLNVTDKGIVETDVWDRIEQVEVELSDSYF